MTQAAAVVLILWATGIATAGQVAMHFLDSATAHKCKTHDWPLEADQRHRDWCLANGYQI